MVAACNRSIGRCGVAQPNAGEKNRAMRSFNTAGPVRPDKHYGYEAGGARTAPPLPATPVTNMVLQA